MHASRFLVGALLVTAACVESEPADTDLAATDAAAMTARGAADAPSWDPADTLHANSPLQELAGAHQRRVHSIWIAGSNGNRVPLTISARAGEDQNVRIAILGPLENGTRAVLGADGYASAQRTASVSLDVATRGEHLVVVGSYNLDSDTFYDLEAECDNCVSRVDVLATPKQMSLVGPEQLVQMLLGDVMLGYDSDVEVELWASPPMQAWNTTQIGSSIASGTQVNAIVPSSVKAGDDLHLVVREPGGRTLDTGITTRYMPTSAAFARLDKVLYGDLASLQISGVVGFFEGVADLRLYSETRHRELAQDVKRVEHAGQVGNGLNAFDATFAPSLSVAATDGELLSIGDINGNGDYHRLGCFEYCNNLSGLSSCTGGPRTCPQQ